MFAKSKRTATSPFSIVLKEAKCQVTTATGKKWETQYDREYQSLTWLKYDGDDQDKTLVKVLPCSACTKFDSSISRTKNYSSVWIVGSTNHRASNITGPAAIEQHKVVMLRCYALLLCFVFALSKRNLQVYCM